MSEKSQLVYDQRQSTTASGVITFDITATFTPVEGDLPDGATGVFVMKVLAPEDPKSDEFQRVALLSDFGLATNTRDTCYNDALFKPAAGTYITSREDGPSYLYLSPVLTLSFDSLPVAIQAKSVLEQRVDALITEWRNFKTLFLGSTTTTFPLSDAGLVAAAKEKYYAAVAAHTAAVAALAEHTAAYDEASALYDLKTTELLRISEIKELVCPAETLLKNHDTAAGNYFANGRGALLNGIVAVKGLADFPSSAASTLTNAQVVDESQFNSLSSSSTNSFGVAITNVTTACQMLTNQRNTAYGEQQDAAGAKASSAAAKQVAAELVPLRQQAVADALAVVLDLCPSFVP